MGQCPITNTSFPQSAMVQFGTVRYAFFHCQKDTKGYQITITYLFWSPFRCGMKWSQRVSSGWSYTHCSLLTARRQKAVLKCCCKTVNVPLQQVLDISFQARMSPCRFQICSQFICQSFFRLARSCSSRVRPAGLLAAAARLIKLSL